MTFDELVCKIYGINFELDDPEGYSCAMAAWQAATLAEREECAKVCDSRYLGDNNREDLEAKRCAAAIRARSEKGEG